jgi:hypothetical protein
VSACRALDRCRRNGEPPRFTHALHLAGWHSLRLWRRPPLSPARLRHGLSMAAQSELTGASSALSEVRRS